MRREIRSWNHYAVLLGDRCDGHHNGRAQHALTRSLRYYTLSRAKTLSALGQWQNLFMSDLKTANYFEYIINDADSYRALLSGANLEFLQLEPGRLIGRHVRLGLRGGQFSYGESELSLRVTGTFPNLWTLSVVLDSATRSLQHGIEVHPGSLFIHAPGATHDGIYGRNFKVVCIAVRDEVFAKYIRPFDPQFRAAVHRQCSLFELPADPRREIIARFAEAAVIIQSDPGVRSSSEALAQFEEELVCDFLEAAAQEFTAHSIGTGLRAATVLGRVDHVVQTSNFVDPTVAELCAACEVPRRTLNRAFQDSLGMGPATYLRRVRLNRARRALQEERVRPATVSGVAFKLGFWHLGRFAEQYKELFGESPHDTIRCAQPPRGVDGISQNQSSFR